MFDANMRCLSKGTVFFAEVWNTSKRLKAKGIQLEDVLLCKMLDDCEKEPSVEITLNGEVFVVTYDEDFFDKWLVYSGWVDENGELHNFIKDKIKQKAMETLNKEKQYA